MEKNKVERQLKEEEMKTGNLRKQIGQIYTGEGECQRADCCKMKADNLELIADLAYFEGIKAAA